MSTIGRPSDQAVATRENGPQIVGARDPKESGGSASYAGPQLSDLGKRIEMLRVDRGVSKQVLARAAGTSRQQLWRVMTGKSELTSTLCQRLASVLDVDSRTLSFAAFAGAGQARASVTLPAGR